MKSIDLKAFRKSINFTQDQLGEYLGCKKAFISALEHGTRPIPEEMFGKLLNNPYGWDVSMLSAPSNPIKEEEVVNNSLIGYLQRKVAELESKVEKLNNEKAELLQENAVLKYENMMLSPRKGDAEDARDSSSASAI